MASSKINEQKVHNWETTALNSRPAIAELNTANKTHENTSPAMCTPVTPSRR